MSAAEPYAWFAGLLATDLVEVSDDPSRLDDAGWWAVCVTYEGKATFARFATVRHSPLPLGRWRGPAVAQWVSSMGEAAYIDAVSAIKEHIAAGDIYQGNVCRVLRARVPDSQAADAAGLAALLQAGNPAPFEGVISIPAGAGVLVPGSAASVGLMPDPVTDAGARLLNDAGVAGPVVRAPSPAPAEPPHVRGLHVVTASPELFLRRDGRTLTSRPIKGTAASAAGMLDKDIAENIMIVDLVRNDLSVVCEAGSVDVPEVVVPEEHPGLVHLVSTVTGTMRADVGWSELLAATFPPGSVTGCPKPRAMDILASVEFGPRGPYCGAVGWVDADSARAELAVGIRTFWLDGGDVCFGVGAGITADSDPRGEWAETELKARHLLAVAAGRTT